MRYDQSPVDLGGDLVYRFFWQFSVFECALKREGFLREGSSGEALADWGSFSRAIRGEFARFRRLDFEDALALFATNPPRRQVVRDGQLGWDSIERRSGDTDEWHVLLMLRTVRNNLFHGGKYPDGPIDEVERNAALIEAGL